MDLTLKSPSELTNNEDPYKSNCNNTLEHYKYDDLDCNDCMIDCKIDYSTIKKGRKIGDGASNVVYS